MRVEVQLFAAAKQLAGQSIVKIELAEEANVADLLQALAVQIPQLADLVSSCRLALDCCYATESQRITGSQEISLIPPVSGG